MGFVDYGTSSKSLQCQCNSAKSGKVYQQCSRSWEFFKILILAFIAILALYLIYLVQLILQEVHAQKSHEIVPQTSLLQNLRILQEVHAQKSHASQTSLLQNLRSTNHTAVASANETLDRNILIVYAAGKMNHPKSLADTIALGAASVVGTQHVLVKEVSDADFKKDVVEWADAVILGSPVWNANVHPDLQKWIDDWEMRANLSSKIGAAFVTAGGTSAGEEVTMLNLLHSMMIFRMIIVGGDRWSYAFGASAIVEEAPYGNAPKNSSRVYFPQVCYVEGKKLDMNQLFLDRGIGLGKRVANVAKRIARV